MTIKTPLHHYVLSNDGCDETFEVYQGDEHLASFPFWEKRAEAEAQAKRLVALLSAASAEETTDDS